MTLDETTSVVPQNGKRLLEPLKTLSLAHEAPIHILEDVDVQNAPEIHLKESDLWICISGNPTFIVGGTMVDGVMQKRSDGMENPDELTGKSIEGGTRYELQAGDMLFIPAGIPHAHAAQGSARLYIIKIPKTTL